MKINVELFNFDKDQKTKYLYSLSLMICAIDSDDLTDFLCISKNHNEALTEMFRQLRQIDISLEVILKPKDSRRAFTTVGSKTHYHGKSFLYQTPQSLAGTVAHELCHSPLGYSHKYSCYSWPFSYRQKSDTAYQVGRIIKELSNKMI